MKRAPEVLLAGVVGSTRGWLDAGLIDLPCGVENLAVALAKTPHRRCRIVPGVAACSAARSDLMRGEEVQVLGVLADRLAPADGLFCLPGTHNKWVETSDGRITTVATVMTGELFALLRDRSMLAEMIVDAVVVSDDFDEGVAAGLRVEAIGRLFEVRASVLLDTRYRAAAATFASGLLIGSDVRAFANVRARTVHLVASKPQATLYNRAIEMAGGRTVLINAATAFVAGAYAAWLDATAR